jgi:membrane associated rhomboid family serine protease
MMFSKDNNPPPSRWEWIRSATVILLVLNVIAFVVQKWLSPAWLNDRYVGLSFFGLRQGFVWQPLTYQFMHGSWMHLILNCWVLFVVGREVEWAVGKARFLLVYFSSGIVGGLLQVLATLFWPQYFGKPDVPTVGASASVFGIVAAFAMLFPDDLLVVLLLFVIPIKMRAKSMLWLVLLVTAFGISFPLSRLTALLGAHVAHVAHLGGILTGLAFSRFYLLKFLPPPMPAVEQELR